MRLDDLRALPKLRDSLSYLYVEHCRVDREQHAIAVWDQDGKTLVPAASLALLMLGPGTTVTHAAVMALADNNCLSAWCGEHGVRFYAHGVGGSRRSAPLLRQAELATDPGRRLEVAKRMYASRFQEECEPGLTLEQLRGWEGRRVRDAYAKAAAEAGIVWSGRNYDRSNWAAADPPNRALTAANACLYGVCHAAILSLGLSPALGFIHTGTQLSFVYDVADLYKTAVGVPAAFRAVAEGTEQIERRTRLACRDAFHQINLLGRLADDLPRLLGLRDEQIVDWFTDPNDPGMAGSLWDPQSSSGVDGGVNYFVESPDD
jgi:CRISPR-associated protein Cas1